MHPSCKDIRMCLGVESTATDTVDHMLCVISLVYFP